jgi:ribosome recycling factor
MSFDFKKFEEEKNKITEYLHSEYRSLQTGRASPQVLDLVQIEVYGSKMAVPHVASVNIEDARTLRVSPYDKSILRDLEKEINNANLGVSVSSDSEGLRIFFPAPTTESRLKMVKIIKDKLEDARVKIRGAREENKKEIERMGREGGIGKDDEERDLEGLQNLVDIANKELEQIYLRKEKDVMGED